MDFYNDISRSWVVGEAAPTDQLRRLYEVSRTQLERNIAQLRAGTTLMEFGGFAHLLPREYLHNRYAELGHGCGLGIEYPLL